MPLETGGVVHLEGEEVELELLKDRDGRTHRRTDRLQILHEGHCLRVRGRDQRDPVVRLGGAAHPAEGCLAFVRHADATGAVVELSVVGDADLGK